MKIIGVDLGGTKITAVMVENEQIIAQFTCSTPPTNKNMEVVKAIEQAISEVFEAEVVGIGIGVPGLVDLANNTVIDVMNIAEWNSVPLKALIEKRFARPAYVNNDANCFALAEKYFGKGKPFSNFVGITLGTGLGAGIVINNHLYSGNYCGAGEFGTIAYRDGMVENYACGQFFKSRGISGAETYQKALAGNTEALLLFYELGEHIGRAIANVLFALAPEAIVLGGSVSKSFKFFEKGMNDVLKNEFPYQRLYQSLKIFVSEIDDSAGLGASSLVLDAVI